MAEPEKKSSPSGNPERQGPVLLNWLAQLAEKAKSQQTSPGEAGQPSRPEGVQKLFRTIFRGAEPEASPPTPEQAGQVRPTVEPVLPEELPKNTQVLQQAERFARDPALRTNPEALAGARQEIEEALRRGEIPDHQQHEARAAMRAIDEQARRIGVATPEASATRAAPQPDQAGGDAGAAASSGDRPKQRYSHERDPRNRIAFSRPDKAPGVFGMDERREDLLEGISESDIPERYRGFDVVQEAFASRRKPVDYQEASAMARRLNDQIEQLTREGRPDPSEISQMVDLRNRYLAEAFRQEELASIPTSFSITTAEMNEMINNPIAAMDKWVGDLTNRLIINPENPEAQEMIHRLRLKLSFFLTDTFDESVISVNLQRENGGLQEITPELRGQIADMKSQMGSLKEKYLDTYVTKLNAARFLSLFKDSAEVGNERFQGMVNSMKERDWFSIDGMYGGITGDAVNILKRKYEAKLYDEHGRPRLLLPKDWIEAINETSEELRQNRERYEGIYKDYLNGQYFGVERPGMLGDAERGEKLLPFVDELNTDPTKKVDAARDITNLAAVRMIMWLDKSSIDIRGLSPTAGNFMRRGLDITEGPATFLRKYKIESISRLMSFHTEVWFNQSGRPEGERRFMRHVAKTWATVSPDIGKWADERTNAYWERLERYRGGDHSDVTLPGELRYLFFYTKGGPPSEHDIHEFMSKLTKKQLREECLVRSGIDIAESHYLRPYFNIESSWRRGMISDYLTEYMKPMLVRKYGDERGSAMAKNLFMSGKLVGAANEYFMSKLHHGGHGEHEYLDVIQTVAGYRPHDMAMAMYETRDAGILGKLRELGVAPGQEWKYLSDLALTSSMINRSLLRNQNMIIDYAGGFGALDAEQQEIVSSVFKSTDGIDTAARDRYFGAMRDLAAFTRANSRVFTDMRYEPLLTKPRWSDDMPIDLIEYPERLGDVAKEKRMTPFSQIMTGGGWDEQSGAMRRMWRDLALAEKGKELILNSPEPNKEEFIKRQKQLYFLIVPYQGEKHAALAITSNMAGFLGMARVYDRFGPLFEGMKNSSDFKSTFGELAYSMSADELHHIASEVQHETVKQTAENLGDAAGLFHAMEEYNGITYTDKAVWKLARLGGIIPERWIPRERFRHNMNSLIKTVTFGKVDHGYDRFVEWADEYWPTGNLRLKLGLMPLYVLLLLGIYTATVATKEGKDATGGGH